MNTASLPHIRWLSEIRDVEKELFGGKAAQLSLLIKQNLHVPRGFALSTKACEEHFNSHPLLAELLERLCSSVNLHERDELGKRIREELPRTHISPQLRQSVVDFLREGEAKYFAVRSSAPQEDGERYSWAGQFESFLGVSQEDIEAHILLCWASAFSERAQSYGGQTFTHEQSPHIGVIIQEMVNADFSGVAFSKDPVSGENVLIEYIQGLAEPLVSGEVIPDKISISPMTGEMIEYRKGNQNEALRICDARGLSRQKISSQSLGLEYAQRLAKVALALETAFAGPVDIEWCFKGSVLILLQARPITTQSPDDFLKRSKNILSLRGQFEFSWAECHSVMTAENWLRNYITHRHIPGNACRNGALFSDGNHVSSFLFRNEKPICRADGALLLSHEGFESHLSRSKRVQTRWKELLAQWTAEGNRNRENLLWYYEQYQALFDETYALYKISQPECSDALAIALRERIALLKVSPEVEQEIFQLATLATELDIIQCEELDSLRLCESAQVNPEDSLRWQMDYAWQFFNTYQRETATRFQEVRFEDLRALRPSLREARIAELLELPSENNRRRKALECWNDSEIIRIGQNLGKLGVDRFLLKSCWAGAEFRFLDLLEEIAQIADVSLEDFLFSYRAEDICRLLRDGERLSSERGEQRKIGYALVLSDGKLEWFEGKEAHVLRDLIIPRHSIENVLEITGTTANLGFVQGRVRKIRVEGLDQLLADLASFEEGDILVTTMTQPTMVALARKAAAVITDEGGATCHAAIIARELNLPCIVGAQFATEVLNDGELVEVDAYRGLIRRLEHTIT